MERASALAFVKTWWQKWFGSTSEPKQAFLPDGTRYTSKSCSRIGIFRKKRAWKRFVKKLEPYPHSFHGKGIVTCAGGTSYFTCAWVNICLLRKKGCSLPIELWHQDHELNGEAIGELKKLGVVCKNFKDYTHEKVSHGYQLKPLAILHSSFKEVLYLDADNNCLADPAYLFEQPEYREKGAAFWPDYWKTSGSNPIWKIVGAKDNGAPEQESGQLLINKEACWKELNLCRFFNLDPFYYQILWGDKDTFRFAWLALKRPFSMVQERLGALGFREQNLGFFSIAMMQHDYRGKPLFIHANLLKWDARKDQRRFWLESRRFRPGAREQKFLFKYHPGFQKHFLSLEGDLEKTNIPACLAQLERESLEVLMELRGSPFYSAFFRQAKAGAKHRLLQAKS